MPFAQTAICPCCRKEATSDHYFDGIEVHFGWRYDNSAPQSYCRACRAARCSPSDKKCVCFKYDVEKPHQE
jgi:hypothetical protein